MSSDPRPAVKPDNFSWVEEWVLAGSNFPESNENLQFFVNENIGTLVSLTSERQLDRTYLTEAELEIISLPVVDFTPPTMEQVAAFIHAVLDTKSKGKGTVVHCAHGLGRTGTMLSCYFVQTLGLSPEDAIAQVRSLRPGSVETPQQEELVANFYTFLQVKKAKGE